MPIPADYRISLDPADLQLEVIHGFLSRAYWSPGIPSEVVAQAAQNSLVAGAYHASGAQVGFARMVTDRTTFGYLSDVFVLEEHRGKGLARAMTLALLELPEVGRFKRITLATRDAHGIYEACGFERVVDAGIFIQIVRKDLYGSGELANQGEPYRFPIIRIEEAPEALCESGLPPAEKPFPHRIPMIRTEESPQEEMAPQGPWPLPGLVGAFYRALLINRK